jgi:class 3 adenylate cyclase
LIRYDNRGSGLSDRDVVDVSFESMIRDLEAVVERLKLERFALLGIAPSGPAAIAYAAHHPELVSHLILWCTYDRPVHTRLPQFQAIRRLGEGDWELFTETMAHALVAGWSSGEQAHRFAALMRASTAPHAAWPIHDMLGETEVTDLLAELTTATLVMHRVQARFPEVEVARRMASRIRDARLALFGGDSLLPFAEDADSVASAIDEFLGESKEAAKAAEHLPSATAVILFADIADSTGLTERLGDAAFRERARELDGALRGVIREHDGTPIEGKLLGDGVLAVFTSAQQAIEAALRCGRAGDDAGLPLHLGLHAGDVIREGNNVYGGAVNIAARIAAASEPGEILVSDIVRGLARTSAGVTFDDRGQRKLKGVEGRQRLFAVGGEAGG